MSKEKVSAYKSLSSLSNNDKRSLAENSTDLGKSTVKSNLELNKISKSTPSREISRNASKFNSMKISTKNNYNDTQTGRDLEPDDGENYLIRQFNTTKKGTVINRGDSISFRRRSTRVRSLKFGSFSSSGSFSRIDKNSIVKEELDNLFFEQNESNDSENNDKALMKNHISRNCISNSRLYSIVSNLDSVDTIESYYVYMLGASGVGKNSLIKQFETSEYRGIYEIKHNGHNADQDKSEPISIMLDGIESHIYFKSTDIDLVKLDIKLIDNSDEFSDNDGYIIVYSVTDRQSFGIAIDILNNLVYFEKTELPIILVGNKSDLVRKRSISREEGKSIANKYGSKFVETSVAIHDKVDDLLAGILKQIRLNKSNFISDENKLNGKNEKFINNSSNNISDFQIKNLTVKKDQSISASKTKHLSLMKGNVSFFKKLFNSVFKKKASKLNGSNSVENLFSPVPSVPCETILHDNINK